MRRLDSRGWPAGGSQRDGRRARRMSAAVGPIAVSQTINAVPAQTTVTPQRQSLGSALSAGRDAPHTGHWIRGLSRGGTNTHPCFWLSWTTACGGYHVEPLVPVAVSTRHPLSHCNASPRAVRQWRADMRRREARVPRRVITLRLSRGRICPREDGLSRVNWGSGAPGNTRRGSPWMMSSATSRCAL